MQLGGYSVQNLTTLHTLAAPPHFHAYPPQLVVGNSTGVHEGLGNDQEHGIYIVRRLHIKHKLGIFDYVDPEPEGQAAKRRNEERQG